MAAADQRPARKDVTTPPPSPPVPALRPAPPAPPPKRRLWLWLLAGLVGLGLAFGAYGLLWMGQPLAVVVERAALAPVTRVLAVNGRIEAVDSVDIRSLVTGILTERPVAEGDTVTQGQVLARIDAAAQNAVVRQAMAGLDAALVAQQQAQETYARSSALGGNVARSVLEADAHAVQTAAQEVARQTATLEQARIALENHTITAPMAGTVLTLDAELGQLVGPSTALLTLADLDNLVVETNVDETYATQIAQNQPAVLQLAGETGTRAGFVSFVSTRVDVNTGGLAIKIAFDDPVKAPIGLTVTTNIIVEQRDAALTVPRTALTGGADGTGVFLLRDGIARRQPVEVIDWPAARLIVTQGLAPGDVLITDATDITDGQAVVVDAP